MERSRKKQLKMVLLPFTVLLFLTGLLYWIQHFWAHRTEAFIPDYPQVELTENTDYETIFLQTGLGRSAAEKLIEAGEFEKILDAQRVFFNPPKSECIPLFGWFTREDRLQGGKGTPLVDLQPGDIVITLATHSAGWRHGHAGLVIDEDSVLECGMLGTDSSIKSTENWTAYSDYAVLRIKGVTWEQKRLVKEYALEYLYDVPYRLLAGLIGAKAPKPDAANFGLQCAYLVWYAWNQFGYDLDGNGGRLVLAQDLMSSEYVEIVQVYGMDPRKI